MQRFMAGLVLVVSASAFTPATSQGAAGVRGEARLTTPAKLVFTRHFNLFMMDSLGGALRTVTSRGTGYQGVYYPWYAWSPDGKYLLVVRNQVLAGGKQSNHLLLLDANGALLRDLATLPQDMDFYPAWASDANQIAYVAWNKFPKNAATPYNAVDVVDVLGHKRFLYGYTSTGEGCGGGTGDPAQSTYWNETGFGDVPPAMQWSVGWHRAIYSASCAGGLKLTNWATHTTRSLGTPGAQWNEAAVSRTDVLAATVRACPAASAAPCASHIVLVNLRSGAIIRRIPRGALPTWSSDGRILYFTEQVPGRTLHMQDELGNKVGFQTQTSAIWRANADGSHTVRLLTENAFGFGMLNVTPDGQSLIFSRVDNDWNIYNHRLAGNRYTRQILQLYGPQVQIQRFDSGKPPVTIAINAGRPAVQP